MVDRFQSTPAITEQIHRGYSSHLLRYDQQALGYLALVPDPATTRKLYLQQNVRGCGLSKRLLDHAIDPTRASAGTSLWLSVNRQNHSTIEWYKRRGFHITSKRDIDIGAGFVMKDYVMELAIDAAP
jgi:diamine N-acetyltransferase